MKFFSAVSLFLFMAIAGFRPAAAAVMTYDVYASGVHVLEATLTIDETRDRYNIVLDSHTRGFLGALVPWKGIFETKGWRMSKSDMRPELHRSHTFSGDEESKKEYRYLRKSGFKELLVTEKGKTKKREAEPKLTKDTVDSLTATLKVLEMVSTGKECKGQSDIYDGWRRFTQVFHPQKGTSIEKSTYNVYAGPASVCTVEVVPKGGEWHKKPRGWMSIQEQGRKAGALPTLWLAKVNKNGLAVPVKIRVKTSYGTLMLHLAEYKDGTSVITSEKRKK